MINSNFPGGGVNIKAATAEAPDVLLGKTFYSGAKPVKTGAIPSKAAQTYTPCNTNQTITAGQYLAGDQTIAGDAGLLAANIKKGVTLYGVAGSYGIDSSAMLAGDVLIYHVNDTLVRSANSGPGSSSVTEAGWTVTFLKPGTIRLKWASWGVHNWSENAGVWISALVNNVTVASTSHGLYSGVVRRSTDISIKAGDVLSFGIGWSTGGYGTTVRIEVSGFTLSVAGNIDSGQFVAIV